MQEKIERTRQREAEKVPVSKADLINSFGKLQRYVLAHVSDEETNANLLNSISLLQKEILKAAEAKKQTKINSYFQSVGKK